MLTAEQLRAIMPALPSAKGALLLPFLTAALDEFGITSAPRVAAFLAQLAHESGQFRFMEEIWGPTATQQRYEPQSALAARLGNTEPGDGVKFKGRGPIQITGRANYQRFGDLLGTDLIAEPARAAHPEVAFRIAGLFWSKKGLNELADERTDAAFREITRRINGGFNGLDDRLRFYGSARTVLGIAAAPMTRGGQGPARPRAAEPAFGRGWEAIASDTSAETSTTRRARATARKRTRKTVTRGAKKSRAGARGTISGQRTSKAAARRAPAGKRTGKNRGKRKR